MIDTVDTKLIQWVHSVLPDVDVSLDSSEEDAAPSKACVGLYLTAIEPSPAPRGSRPSPVRIRLRYLVTARAPEPREAHRLIGELVFAAMEQADLTVEAVPQDHELYAAFGIKSRDGFQISTNAQRERVFEPEPYVRHPVSVQLEPIGALHGRVCGPADVPLANAVVEIPGLLRNTRTDADGFFSFAGIAANQKETVLKVRARGKEFTITLDPEAAGKEPLLIRLKDLAS